MFSHLVWEVTRPDQTVCTKPCSSALTRHYQGPGGQQDGTFIQLEEIHFHLYIKPLRNHFRPRGEHLWGWHFVKVECDAPEDGDVNLITRRVVILHPGTQVEEAREQQVEGWHQHSHEEHIKPFKFSLCEVSLRIHSSHAEQVLNVPWGCLRNAWNAQVV